MVIETDHNGARQMTNMTFTTARGAQVTIDASGRQILATVVAGGKTHNLTINSVKSVYSTSEYSLIACGGAQIIVPDESINAVRNLVSAHAATQKAQSDATIAAYKSSAEYTKDQFDRAFYKANSDL